MLIALSLAATLTGQTPPSPPSGPEVHSQTRVVTLGWPGRGRDLDKDGDGRVTEDEFMAPMRDAFRRLDKDGSGALEDGERSSVR